MNELNEDEVFHLHRKQQWGAYPYSVHLRAVETVAAAIEDTPLVRAVAIHHDVLEDTKTRPEELSEQVRETVVLLSRNYSQGKLTYVDYIRKIAMSENHEAQVVKFADAVANWTLCQKTGDLERAKRYERSICILYSTVFKKPVQWDHVRKLSSLIDFSVQAGD